MKYVYGHVGVFVVVDDTVVVDTIVVEGIVTMLLFVTPGHVLVPFSVT
jgi:hypothetical protein